MCYECMWGIIQGAELDIIPVRATTGYQQRHQITMEQTFFFLLIPTPLEAPFGNLILASKHLLYVFTILHGESHSSQYYLQSLGRS